MIKIAFDECSGNINIELDPGSEEGTMTVEELVMYLVAMVGGIAGFLRDDVDITAMHAFFDSIRALDDTALLGLLEAADEEMNNQE